MQQYARDMEHQRFLPHIEEDVESGETRQNSYY
jgi:hypothetical protein